MPSSAHLSARNAGCWKGPVTPGMSSYHRAGAELSGASVRLQRPKLERTAAVVVTVIIVAAVKKIGGKEHGPGCCTIGNWHTAQFYRSILTPSTALVVTSFDLPGEIRTTGGGKPYEQFGFLFARLPSFSKMPSHLGSEAPHFLYAFVQRLREKIRVSFQQFAKCGVVSAVISGDTFQCGK